MDPAFFKAPGDLLGSGDVVCHLNGFDQPFLHPGIHAIGNAAHGSKVRIPAHLK